MVNERKKQTPVFYYPLRKRGRNSPPLPRMRICFARPTSWNQNLSITLIKLSQMLR